jgi:hypothetical protein
MKRLALILVTLVCLAPAWAQDTSATVVDGATKAMILVAPAERAGSTVAAIELARIIAKMTGRGLDVLAEGEERYRRYDVATGAQSWAPGAPDAPHTIHIGRTQAVEAAFGDEIAALDQDGFIIRGMNGDLVIAGPMTHATEFGVYAFLEDHCGARWYLPDEIGEVIPRRESLTFEAIDDTQEPAFLMRKFSGIKMRGVRGVSGLPLSTEWEARNRLRARYAFHHNLWRLLNPEVYGEEHPDWFPMIDGARRPPKRNSSSGWQPCMTSEGGIAQIVANIRAEFNANPELNSVSIAPNDGGGYCNCPDCLALSENVGEPTGENRSRLFWQFANRIASEVAKTHPDRIIGTLAYSYSKTPYEGMQLEPNIMPFYVTYPSVFRDEEATAERLSNVETWGDITRQMGVYEWYFGSGYSVPVPHGEFLARGLKHAYDNGARAIYSEVYPNWGLDGWKVWVFSKLLWDPSRDWQELNNDFVSGFFAEAAEPMGEYVALCEDLGRKRVASVDPETGVESFYFFRRPEQFLRWPQEELDRAQALLDAALAACKSAETERRVRYFADSFGVTRILAGRYFAATAALPHADSTATIGEALSELATITGPEWNLPLYMRWTGIEPWQVTEPHERIHGPITLARSLLAGTLSEAAVSRARAAGELTPERIQGELTGVAREALGGRELSPQEKALLDDVSFSAGRVAMVLRTGTAPTIDGDLSDGVWQSVNGQQVPSYGSFFVLQKGTPAEFETTFRLLHDGERLYVAARCLQEKEDYYVTSSGRDGRVWSDDSIEFLLNDPTATDPNDYFQVILNTEAQPNIFDMWQKDAEWNGDIRAAAVRIPGEGWTIEFSVPLAKIGFEAPQTKLLKMNVVRNVIGDRRYLEISNWFPTFNANGDLESRGWLILQ